MASVNQIDAAQQIDAVAELMRGKRTAVLSGAGISTDSGIPDYRGEGAPTRTPMTVQDFLGDEGKRKRYWAGSHLGWRLFSSARPNAGHRTLARLEGAGLVTGVVTQNVDGLHRQAGSGRVVELHGSMDTVSCLDCGQVFARQAIADQLEAANPWLGQSDAVRLAPDGDADVEEVDRFVLPVCTVCGGRLKPDVVFFGELVPAARFAQAAALVARSEMLLVVGSSLTVNSGIRLLEQARRRRLPIVVVNRGSTKGDARAAHKLDAGASETLAALAERLLP
ncbi:NAD-dependent protein deacetylase [Microterricola pindariensis]|uniref:protein acetyllysine N-acetyltransferase n=1 Tax=Microterricola pindariensis TaxID=478010 RepID=A0ABX5B2G8_9MICO|nr:NAD-dependent protein deacetylase [Microterricola pindariensis]PPL20589.1 NAD-dependent deacetylase [Microterricola pindariensis]